MVIATVPEALKLHQQRVMPVKTLRLHFFIEAKTAQVAQPMLFKRIRQPREQ